MIYFVVEVELRRSLLSKNSRPSNHMIQIESTLFLYELRDCQRLADREQVKIL